LKQGQADNFNDEDNMNAPITTDSGKSRLHPLVATAAVAVTVFSIAGIAAIAGWLPTGKSAQPEQAPIATTVVPQAAPAAPPPVVEAKPEPQPAPAPAAPAATEKKVVKPAPRPVAKSAPAEAAPPPAPPRPAPAEVVAAPQPAPVVTAPPPPPPCMNCGTIDNMREVTKPGEASGLGAVAGGVVGAIVGSQIGGGTGKKIATVAGAAGGAYAGHQIEKSQKKTTHYEITVRMTDGSVRTLTQDTLPPWRIGDKVRIENGGLVAAN
jgi:outer membrane lipoprotein SlyB